MTPRFGHIYKITNLVNNKVYIGQTIRDIQVRFKAHCYRAGCPKLHNAILKYGKGNFKLELIEDVLVNELDNREVYWIAYYNSTNRSYGYNILIGGSNGHRTRSKLSPEETKELIKMHEDGVPHTIIGKHFNINRKTVTFIIKRNTKNYINKNINVFDRPNYEEIKNFILNERPTQKQIRERFKIATSNITKIARAINYKFPSSQERKRLGI